MSIDHNQITHLIENSLFEVSTAAKLEAYVAQQLTTKTYDFYANKSLLKYYQVFPNTFKLDVVCNVLILSLMRLPNSDFVSLLYLLPLSVKSGDQTKIKAIQECASFLEKGRYTDFWEEYISAPEALFSAVNGFVDFIRIYILGNLRETYSSMPNTLFAQQLGLNESSVEPFCNGNKFIDKVGISHDVFTSSLLKPFSCVDCRSLVQA